MGAGITKDPRKWIICTKWKFEDSKGYGWTPIGDYDVVASNGKKLRGRVHSYDSLEEAEEVIKDIGEFKSNSENLMFAICEVRYVPNRIKVYKDDWFNKYVTKEEIRTIKKENGGLNP